MLISLTAHILLSGSIKAYNEDGTLKSETIYNQDNDVTAHHHDNDDPLASLLLSLLLLLLLLLFLLSSRSRWLLISDVLHSKLIDR